MDDGEADITLDWRLMWCKRHLEQYRGKPQEAMNGSLVLAEYLMNDKKFHGACLGDPKNFDTMVKQFAPVCCYLGDIAVRLVYLETGVL